MAGEERRGAPPTAAFASPGGGADPGGAPSSASPRPQRRRRALSAASSSRGRPVAEAQPEGDAAREEGSGRRAGLPITWRRPDEAQGSRAAPARGEGRPGARRCPHPLPGRRPRVNSKRRGPSVRAWSRPGAAKPLNRGGWEGRPHCRGAARTSGPGASCKWPDQRWPPPPPPRAAPAPIVDEEPAAWAPVRGLRDPGLREGLLCSGSVWGGKQVSVGSPAQVRGARQHLRVLARSGSPGWTLLEGLDWLGWSTVGQGPLFPQSTGLSPFRPSPALVALGLAWTAGLHPSTGGHGR